MNHVSTTRLLALSVCALVVASSCRTPGETAAGPPDLAGTWIVESVHEDGWTTVHVGGAAEPLQVTFEAPSGADAEGRVGGWDGVNRFSGGYSAGADGSLTIGPLASTRRAGPPEAMQLATQLVRVLQDAQRYGVSGETLRIEARAGSLELRRSGTDPAAE